VAYEPYEGKNNLYDGQGGTKLVVDGIDFWANGTPPRKYTIIGFVTSEIGSGYGDEAMIRTSVASEVKKRGGEAAIQVSNNTSFTGMFKATSSMYMATGARQMRFAVIKYQP
jgi:hypothetical protein